MMIRCMTSCLKGPQVLGDDALPSRKPRLGAVEKTAQTALAGDSIVATRRPPDLGPLHAELSEAVNARLVRRYGERAFLTAKAWGTDDIASVQTIVESIDLLDSIPKTPSDILLHRYTEKHFLDGTDSGRILNNPRACARIRDRHRLELSEPARYAEEPHRLKPRSLVPVQKWASDYHNLQKNHCNAYRSGILQNGGINVLMYPRNAETYNRYSKNDENCVDIVCTLDDVLNRGGIVHSDTIASTWNAAIVEMPQGVGLPYITKQSM